MARIIFSTFRRPFFIPTLKTAAAANPVMMSKMPEILGKSLEGVPDSPP
jgi:hypothetical protein